MLEYKLVYSGERDEEFSLTDKDGKILMHPAGGFTDFMCYFIDEYLLPSRDQVSVDIEGELPDYYGRLVELVVGLYNNIPNEKKPLEI
ncbi:hypothetical protein J4476_01885 [Candidatus Woesearchaeota archaeon]|nr:MAG: hypothetical protein QT09_C0016G0018 [archaeon GW2011_AR18]MBS3161425.1 hypothetical protein [Candidatus Woesearchaeota archaeon]HIH25866.1 hypothetical protein [Nanoarchaeota archaeon]